MQLTSCRTTRRRPEGGFSLIEVVVVVAIVIVVGSFSIAVFQPFMQNSRVNTAYHTAVMQVRRARHAIHLFRPHLRSDQRAFCM